MHIIVAKTTTSKTATTIYRNEILSIDQETKDIFIKRIQDAFNKNSRSFELEIRAFTSGTFFDLAHNIHQSEDSEFIRKSQELAELLANSQTRTGTPGGYFILMEGNETLNHLPLIFAIKAEPHDAIEVNGNALKKLSDIIMSPQQKLFKIGLLYKYNNTETNNIITQYKAYIFDDQFRIALKPAEYFYRDFLGLDIGKNAKIQSQNFFKQAESFIRNNISDLEEIDRLITGLKAIYLSNSPSISPASFMNEYLAEDELQDRFQREILNKFPSSFNKDTTLVRTQLIDRKILFTNGVKMNIPEQDFGQKVSICADPQNSDYTIIRVYGKPYANNNRDRNHERTISN